MSRDLELYLQDVCECIDKINGYIKGIGYDEFVRDTKTVDAVTHNLLIIGEAAKQIPDSIRRQYPEIPWRQIAGLRDVIAHTYFKVNSQIIWDIINVELGPLYETVLLLLKNGNSTH